MDRRTQFVVIVLAGAAAGFVADLLRLPEPVSLLAMLGGAGAAYSVFRGIDARIQARLSDPSHCSMCRYSLVGLEGAVCPECGTPEAADGPRSSSSIL